MNKSKIMLIAAAGAVAVLVGAGIVRCTFSPHDDPAPAPDIEQEMPEDAAAGKEPTEGDGTANADPETDSQAGLAASVADDYLDTRWAAEGDIELTVLDGVFIESNGAESKIAYFAIDDAVDADDVLTLTVWAADRPGDAGSHSIIVIDHSGEVPTITSDLFAMAGTYRLAPEGQSEVVVQAATDDLNSYLEATTSDITSVLTTYAAEHLPGVSALSWTGEAYTDYFNGTRLTTFLADDPAATIITLSRGSDGTLGVL